MTKTQKLRARLAAFVIRFHLYRLHCALRGEHVGLRALRHCIVCGLREHRAITRDEVDRIKRAYERSLQRRRPRYE